MKFSDGISIIIPSWNNHDYLRACISSIEDNSCFKHEVVVHLNNPEKIDLDFLIEKKIKFTSSSYNVGVCKAMNIAYKLCTKNIIGYFNDDMIALPKWDSELQNFSEEKKCDDSYILASTMIEPTGNNPCCISPVDFGRSISNFEYDNLLLKLEEIRQLAQNVTGSTWPPNFISRNLWDAIDGYSEEYGAGFGSDPDLIAKAYSIGCRNFIGVGKSLVYHFQCKTTKKINSTQLQAEEIFKNKFGIEMNYFLFNIIQRGKLL